MLCNTLESREEVLNIWNSESAPESDSTPHINIGSQFQSTIPALRKSIPFSNQEPLKEQLLWGLPTDTYNDNEGEFAIL